MPPAESRPKAQTQAIEQLPPANALIAVAIPLKTGTAIFSLRITVLRLRTLIKRVALARLIFWEFPLKVSIFVPLFHRVLTEILFFHCRTTSQIRENLFTGLTSFGTHLLPVFTFLRTQIWRFFRNFSSFGGGRDRRHRTHRRLGTETQRRSHHQYRNESVLIHHLTFAISVPTIRLGKTLS